MAAIDIPSITDIPQFTATASQTVFTATNYVIYDDDEVSVYARSASATANDSSDILTKGVDYSVSGVGAAGGFTVTLVTGRTAGDIVTLVRTTTLERSTKYVTQGVFPSETVDTDFNTDLLYTQDRYLDLKKRSLFYPYSGAIEDKDRVLPQLGASQFWQMNSGVTGIIAADMEESTGWSSLRTELASQTALAPGSGIVGHYSATNGGTTVSAELAYLLTNIDPLPVDDTESLVKDPVDNSKQMRIDVGAVSASTVRVLTMPDQDFNLTPATSAQVIAGTNDDQPLTSKSLADGSTVILQRVTTSLNSFQTGATAIPLDDTIPQLTEGDEYMTQAITPKRSDSKLLIEVKLIASARGSSGSITVALFQDATANALAAVNSLADNTKIVTIPLTYEMTSGTTSLTTFKVRAGRDTAANLDVNGISGARIFGGVSESNIIITEYI